MFGRSVSGGLCLGGSLSGGGVSVLGGGSLSRGLCRGLSVQGWSTSGECLSRGYLSGRLPPPPVNRMTDTCENITLPQTSFAAGNKAIRPIHVERKQKWNKIFFYVCRLFLFACSLIFFAWCEQALKVKVFSRWNTFSWRTLRQWVSVWETKLTSD